MRSFRVILAILAVTSVLTSCTGGRRISAEGTFIDTLQYRSILAAVRLTMNDTGFCISGSVTDTVRLLGGELKPQCWSWDELLRIVRRDTSARPIDGSAGGEPRLPQPGDPAPRDDTDSTSGTRDR